MASFLQLLWNGDGDHGSVYRGKHHLVSQLGVFNELKWKASFFFSFFFWEIWLFWKKKTHPQIYQSTLRKHSNLSCKPPRSYKQRWLKSDSRLLMVTHNARQCFLSNDEVFILLWKSLKRQLNSCTENCRRSNTLACCQQLSRPAADIFSVYSSG